MRKRSLGNSGWELTTIGLGTWAIGGGDWLFGWGTQDENDSVTTVLRAIECGVNWIDTAAVYGNGKSEEIVGRALSEMSEAERPIVATKCGRIIQSDRSIRGDLSPESIRRECEASLRRLGVDAIDLYQIHWPDPDGDIESAWETMAALKSAGKVRQIGVSNFSVAQLKRIQPIHPVASLQPPYSMIVRGIEDELLPYCAKHQIGVICYSPMYKGLLTGKFDAERAARLSPEDHRSRDPRFQSPQLEVHLRLAAGLAELSARNQRSLAELAIAWVLRRPEVTAAIVGSRRPDQVTDTAPAADWELDASQFEQFEELLADHAQAIQALGS